MNLPAAEAWSNWGGNVTCLPRRVAAPRTEAELRAVLADARRERLNVRVAGAGHSFSPLVASDGLLLSLDQMAKTQAIGVSGSLATVPAGARISELGETFLAAGAGLINQGDIDVQSVAGAIATGTHGTGRTLGSLSSAVAGMRVMNAAGECQEIADAETLGAAALGLGLFGVVMTVTLRTIPRYRLRERIWREPVAATMAALDRNISSHRHFEFFWFPETDECECKALDPVDAGAVAGEGERIDWSHRIFPSVRSRKFVESEWTVPDAVGPRCFNAIRALMRARHGEVKWPVEYRTLAGDSLDLSPTSGRASVTISIHQGAERPWHEFFADAQRVFLAHDGRPHWGKWHSLDAAHIRALYPRLDHFMAVRERFDPAGLFLSPDLRALLG